MLLSPAIRTCSQHLKCHGVRTTQDWILLQFNEFQFKWPPVAATPDGRLQSPPLSLAPAAWPCGAQICRRLLCPFLPCWSTVRWCWNLPLQVLQGRHFKMWIYCTDKQKYFTRVTGWRFISSSEPHCATLNRPHHCLTVNQASSDNAQYTRKTDYNSK